MEYKNFFIVCDTETGGIPNKNTPATISIALTEIAFISVENKGLEIKNQLNFLIKPYAEDLIYNPEAAKVSGITKESCEKEGIEIEEAYKSCVKFLKEHTLGRQKPIMIFHNKKFDIPFIENLFQIFNDSLNNYIESSHDTLEWARLKYKSLSNFKLGAVAEACELDLVQAHRALQDTLITAKIWINFMKSLRGENQLTQKEEVKFREKFKF